MATAIQSTWTNKCSVHTLQAGTLVLEEDTAQLWWAGKMLSRDKKLSDYLGRNEKTTIVAKLQKKGQGAPGREPVFSEEEQKKMMAYAYRKQEEFKVGDFALCDYVLLCF